MQASRCFVSLAVVLILLMVSGSASYVSAQGCSEKEKPRLPAGDWKGTFEKKMTASGGELNMNMQLNSQGTFRFHVTDDGKISEFQGEYISNPTSSTRFGSGSGTGVGSGSAEISLNDQKANTAEVFNAEGQVRLRMAIAARVEGATANTSRAPTGNIEMEFKVTGATCASGHGTWTSPNFDRARTSFTKQGLTIKDSPGVFTVTSDNAKANEIRNKTKSALSACPSFLSDTEKCMPAINSVTSSIKREPNEELRTCLTHVFLDEMATTLGRWIDEAVQIFKANTASKSSACFNYPYITKAMKIGRWFALMSENQCAQDAKQKQLFDAIVDLNKSYEARVSKGEARREVYGLPCPAMTSDPAQANAAQQYLDMVYKKLGLSKPQPLVVR